MEDACLSTTLEISQNHQVRLDGVFDGHGGGKDCASYLENELPDYLSKRLKAEVLEPGYQGMDLKVAVWNLLKCMYPRLTLQYRNCHKQEDELDCPKSTATAVVRFGNMVWAACAGDSRAILVKRSQGAYALSEDAKVGELDPEPAKYARDSLKRRGEIVKHWEADLAPPALRVFKYNVVALNMTRSVGHSETNSGVNPRAKVICPSEAVLAEGDFTLVASDGLWDVMSSNQAGDIVRLLSKLGKSCAEIANIIVNKAFEWGSRDNITAVVSDLRARVTPAVDPSPGIFTPQLLPSEQATTPALVPQETMHAGLIC